MPFVQLQTRFEYIHLYSPVECGGGGGGGGGGMVGWCDWLVGCFGFNGPLRQYFSLYRAVSQREGEREEKG